MTQISSYTLEAHIHDVTSCKTLSRYRQDRDKGKSGKLSVISVAAIDFIESYSGVYGTTDPYGRNSTALKSGCRLPSGVFKISLYEAYKEQWKDLDELAHARDSSFGSLPAKPLEYPGFVKVSNSRCSHISMALPGSDYCDNCTTLKNAVDISANEHTCTTLKSTLEKHMSEAKLERLYLQNVRQELKRENSTVLHLILDFSEKVFLPSLLKQPGQLHFAASLKLNLFAVSCGKNGKTYVFSPREGHWPGKRLLTKCFPWFFMLSES